MPQVVYIRIPLRQLANGRAKVVASGNDIAELLEGLEATFCGFKEHICDGDEVLIIPVIAGAARPQGQSPGSPSHCQALMV